MSGDRAIKWSYMDHWRSNEPSGPRDQWHNRDTMDRFLKQVAAVGFDAIDVFDFRMLWILSSYGSVANYQEFVQERGLERIVNIFHGVDYDPRDYAPHVRATHPAILEDLRRTMDAWSGIALDNVLVMPAYHSAAISTKMLQELGGSTVIGPLLVGFDKPVQIVSLAARDSDIVNMAALAAFNLGG